MPVAYAHASDHGASVEVFKSGDVELAWFVGVVSLGDWIQGARAKPFYDERLVLFGAGLVVAADLTSAAARDSIRRRG